MTANDDSPWLRFEEVNAWIEQIEDERLRAFLRFGLTTIVTRQGTSDSPAAPFDVYYFAQVLRSMFERNEVLESIVSGDFQKHAWFDD